MNQSKVLPSKPFLQLVLLSTLPTRAGLRGGFVATRSHPPLKDHKWTPADTSLTDIRMTLEPTVAAIPTARGQWGQLLPAQSANVGQCLVEGRVRTKRCPTATSAPGTHAHDKAAPRHGVRQKSCAPIMLLQSPSYNILKDTLKHQGKCHL